MTWRVAVLRTMPARRDHAEAILFGAGLVSAGGEAAVMVEDKLQECCFGAWRSTIELLGAKDGEIVGLWTFWDKGGKRID